MSMPAFADDILGAAEPPVQTEISHRDFRQWMRDRERFLTPQMFVSSAGDGMVDSRAGLNELLTTCASLGQYALIPAGTYRIVMAIPDGEFQPCGIILPSNVRVVCEPGAEFVADPVEEGNYQIIRAYDAENWQWSGGKIIGERDAHLGETGEYGFGLAVRGCNNYTIDDLEAVDCWGDGLYIGPSPTQNWSENGWVSRLRSSNNRRNNVSIVSAVGLRGSRWTLKNANGTSPETGLDIEPSSETDRIENVVIDGIDTAENTNYGISVSIATGANPVSLAIKGHTSNSEGYSGFRTNTSANAKGLITYEDFVIMDSFRAGVALQPQIAAGPHVRVANGQIRRPNRAANSSTIVGAGLLVSQELGTGKGVVGNCEINNVEIIDDRETPLMTKAISVVDVDGNGVRAVSIRSPRSLVGATSSAMLFRGALAGAGGLPDCLIEDPHGQLNINLADATATLSTSVYGRTYSNEAFTATRVVTLPPWNASSNLRMPQTFIIRVAQTLRLSPGTGITIIGQGSTGAGKYIQSNEIGARLTIEMVDATTWRITDLLGLWTWQA